MSAPQDDNKRLENAVRQATKNVANVVEQILAQIHAQSGVNLNFALTVYEERSDYGNTVTSLDPDVVENLFAEAVGKIKDQAAFNRAAALTVHSSDAIN